MFSADHPRLSKSESRLHLNGVFQHNRPEAEVRRREMVATTGHWYWQDTGRDPGMKQQETVVCSLTAVDHIDDYAPEGSNSIPFTTSNL